MKKLPVASKAVWPGEGSAGKGEEEFAIDQDRSGEILLCKAASAGEHLRSKWEAARRHAAPAGRQARDPRDLIDVTGFTPVTALCLLALTPPPRG